MIRLTKLTDYGIVLMSHLAAEPDSLMTASSLALETQISMPTVAKILKVLAREQLLASYRGANGGYVLDRDPRDISVADVIAAMEGPIAVTECSELGPGECAQESVCRVRTNWQMINDVVRDALASISLAQMAQPWSLPLGSSAPALIQIGSTSPQ